MDNLSLKDPEKVAKQAKDLVNDVINGFFILFENQYAVGDHVKIGTFSGIVESH